MRDVLTWKNYKEQYERGFRSESFFEYNDL